MSGGPFGVLQDLVEGERHIARAVPQAVAAGGGLIVAEGSGMRRGEDHVSGLDQLEREPALRISRSPVAVRDDDQRVLARRRLRIRVAGDRDRAQRQAWGEPLDPRVRGGLEPQLGGDLAARRLVLEIERRGADNGVGGAGRRGVEQEGQQEPGASRGR